MEKQDWELCAEANAGDQEAFRQLYQEYGKLVECAVRYILQSRRFSDPHAITELSGEAWRKALPGYDHDKGPFLRYIRTIARNLALDSIARPVVEVPTDMVRFVQQETHRGIGNTLPLAPVKEEMLRLSMSLKRVEPSKLIVFGFGRLVGQKTGAIAEEHSSHSLFDLAAKLEDEVCQASDLAPDFIKDCFQPLRGSLSSADGVPNEKGQRTLESYYAVPHKAEVYLADWIYNVKKRLLREIFAEEEEFLKTALSEEVAPHLVLHLAFVSWLGWSRSDFSARLYDVQLREVESIFEQSYALRSVSRPPSMEQGKPLDPRSPLFVCMKPLRDLMERQMSDVIPANEKAATPVEFLRAVAGETTMRQYYDGRSKVEADRLLNSLRSRIRDLLYERRRGLLFAATMGYL